MKRRLKSIFRMLLLLFVMQFLVACGTLQPHNGRMPLSWTEGAPKSDESAKGLEEILSYQATATNQFEAAIAQLQPGDVLGFHMSHRDAWKHLRKGKVQKLPYEMLSYGHVSMVVPATNAVLNGATAVPPSDLRLLQVSIFKPVTDSETLEELRDQSWKVFRPPPGSVDVGRLREFTDLATTRADSWTSYDLSSVLGVHNSASDPKVPEEVGREFSCATLIVAALHYSGFELNAVRRQGWFDVVTPRQVIDSKGVVGKKTLQEANEERQPESADHQSIIKVKSGRTSPPGLIVTEPPT